MVPFCPEENNGRFLRAKMTYQLLPSGIVNTHYAERLGRFSCFQEPAMYIVLTGQLFLMSQKVFQTTPTFAGPTENK